ncbi:hypothetical protein, partial [Pseudomonas sp. SIMBA_068]|uniref:hypothetical protein n=1 Tax=Pseudomonas sp. SIMBA_068 TaxID=3085808 RepID=UPI003977E468
ACKPAKPSLARALFVEGRCGPYLKLLQVFFYPDISGPLSVGIGALADRLAGRFLAPVHWLPWVGIPSGFSSPMCLRKAV